MKELESGIPISPNPFLLSQVTGLNKLPNASQANDFSSCESKPSIQTNNTIKLHYPAKPMYVCM